MATPSTGTSSKSFDSVMAQYEKNKQSASGNGKERMSEEDRLKRYFTTILPKNSKGEERHIRILPTKDGSSPFVEVRFHEMFVDGKWVKLYDPAQEGKRSPLNEVRESLLKTGVDSDKELAKDYRSKTFYIVKIIDRDNEADGPKFWRFKYSVKGDGIFDKIVPIYRNKEDIADPVTGRDLILSLVLAKANNGKEYTTINSILNDDPSALSKDPVQLKAWLDHDLTWSDVYTKKPEDYLEMVAKGETPKWSNDTNGWVAKTQEEDTIVFPIKKSEPPVADPQAGEPPVEEEELPF
jgi:hypothetical protein